MRALLTLLLVAAAMPAFSQGHDKGREDLEPAVNTSALPPPAQATPASAPGAAAPAVTAGHAPAAAVRAGGSAPAAKTAHSPKAQDRIDLDTTDITGNKELPKVMYVVPWKHSDLGDLTGKPANSLVDEVLQPVDRDVFNREERYYHTVAAQKPAPAPPSGGAVEH